MYCSKQTKITLFWLEDNTKKLSQLLEEFPKVFSERELSKFSWESEKLLYDDEIIHTGY